MFKDKMGNDLSFTQALPKIGNRLYNYFLDFELMLLRWSGYIPLHSFRIFFYKAAGMHIGKGSAIHMWAQFFQPKNIWVGSDTIIGQRIFLDGRDKLVIGDHVDIASEVMIYNSQHDINAADFKAIEQSVIIGDYTFIGPRVIILPGVNIGRGAVIAAGAVVTKDVPDFTVVAGVPAKPIGERKNKNPVYKLGRARLFQ